MTVQPMPRFVAAFALCALLAPLAGAAQEVPNHLRLGTAPVEVGALVYYAQDEGFFKKAGLDVELIAAANGPAIAAAVASGTIDMGSGNALSIAQAHEKGLNFVYVAPAGAYTTTSPTAACVVARNSPVHTAKDLTGKTIAVATLGSLGEIAFRAWLDQNGGDPSSVKFVEMPYSAMDTAIVAGRVDAAAMEEPALDRLLASDGRILGHCYDAISKDFSEGGYFATADFVKTHLDLVRRFAAVMTQTARWANANQATTAIILQKYSGISTADQTHRVHYHDKLDPAKLQPLVDAAAKYGTLKATFPASEIMAQGL
jgi:ABC-type nitrate/sulfonate/bicarbonate transport system substrate-binding protein